ncbi:MAG TPA: hypothetical protein VIO36_08380 [Anaerolineaceae bacterium]
MRNSTKWIESKQRRALILLGAGALLFAAGGALQRWVTGLPFDARIIGGLGILLLGVGLAQYLTYRIVRGDEKAAARKRSEELDERRVMVRNQAGNRAFWVSLVMGYAGLMWASFASNDQLPALEGNTLWFFLVALVVIPFGVYLASYVRGINEG